jgi:hypothetical protein
VITVVLLVLASLAVGITSAQRHSGARSLRTIDADAVGVIDAHRGAIMGEVPLQPAPRPDRRWRGIGAGHRLQ